MIKVGIVKFSGAIRLEFIELFKKEGMKVETFSTIEEAKNEASELDGLIIVDTEDKMVGEICKLVTQIRTHKQLFIWVYGNNISQINRLVYLQLGVDGNVSTNEAQEFFLIIRNTLSRQKNLNSKDTDEETEKLNTPSFKMISSNQSVLVNGGQEIELTRLEYRILDILSQQPKKTLNYEELYEKLWGKSSGDSKPRLANIVFHLRGKLEKNPLNPQLIKTVRSKGYMFIPPEVKT